jgi:hypothetical protein
MRGSEVAHKGSEGELMGLVVERFEAGACVVTVWANPVKLDLSSAEAGRSGRHDPDAGVAGALDARPARAAEDVGCAQGVPVPGGVSGLNQDFALHDRVAEIHRPLLGEPTSRSRKGRWRP